MNPKLPKWTIDELTNKIEWEGNAAAAIEYGITADDIEDPFVAELWSIAVAAYEAFEQTLVAINKKLGIG